MEKREESWSLKAASVTRCECSRTAVTFAQQPGSVGSEPSLEVCFSDPWENVRTPQAEVQLLFQRRAGCRRGSDKGRLLRAPTKPLVPLTRHEAPRVGPLDGRKGLAHRRGPEMKPVEGKETSHRLLACFLASRADPSGSLEA